LFYYAYIFIGESTCIYCAVTVYDNYYIPRVCLITECFDNAQCWLGERKSFKLVLQKVLPRQFTQVYFLGTA